LYILSNDSSSQQREERYRNRDMNLTTFSRCYIAYLLFNIGGWVYFGHLLYYTSYMTTETCNSYTKEPTDVIKIFVGIAMTLTTANIVVATTSILNNENRDVLEIENSYCFLITSLILLTVSAISSLVLFAITSGMTDIRCSNSNAEFGLKLAVYGVIWIAFIGILLILISILLFLGNIIEHAKFHLLCLPCVDMCKNYRQRRIGIAVATSSISKYEAPHVTIPMPVAVATYKEEPKIVCSICYDASITLLLEPCNHICMCHVCYESLVKKECPICKTEISTTKKVYFASQSR
jgi:hypothetical protein